MLKYLGVNLQSTFKYVRKIIYFFCVFGREGERKNDKWAKYKQLVNLDKVCKSAPGVLVTFSYV